MLEELQRRLGRSIAELEVIEEDKKIIIRGRAQNWHQKQVAQHVVMRHTSKEVVNQIVVRRKGVRTEIAPKEK